MSSRRQYKEERYTHAPIQPHEIEEGDGVAPDPRTFTDNDDWECEEYIESNEEHSRPTNAQYSPTSREYDYGTGHNMRNSFDSCEDPSFEQYSRSGHYAESAHSRARPRPHDAYYDRRDSSRKSTSRVPHDGHSTYRYDFRNGRSERTAEIYRDKDSSRPRMQNSRRTTYDDYWRDPHLSSGRSRHNHGDSYDDDFRQRRSKTVPIGTQYQHSDAHGTDYHSRRPRTYDDYDNPIQHKTSHRSAPSSDRASYTTEHIQKINEAYSKTLSVITIGAQRECSTALLHPRIGCCH